jgi:soluble lytic murein transglycosylase-like protein
MTDITRNHLIILAVTATLLVGSAVAIKWNVSMSELRNTCAEEKKIMAHKIRIEEGVECKDKLYEWSDHVAEEQQKFFAQNLGGVILELQPKLEIATVEKITTTIMEQSKAKNLDPVLITALIYQESSFNKFAIGTNGEIGLMQVAYETWKNDPILKGNGVDGKDKLYHIRTNIKAGTDIFAQYYKESDRDVVKALYRYNSGGIKLPQKLYYKIDYANRVLIRAYKISRRLR